MSQRLENTMRALVEALRGEQPTVLAAPESVSAAVLMPFTENSQGVQVVFTKRTSHLPHHAGQISFPGGAADPEDPDLETTALRETCEELGVCFDGARVVARLDQVVTVTNFLVTPFAGVLAPQAQFAPNPVEVERVILVPVAKVLDKTHYQPHEVTWRGMEFHQLALAHEGDIIWGATARMLLNLLERLGPRAHQVIKAGSGD